LTGNTAILSYGKKKSKVCFIVAFQLHVSLKRILLSPCLRLGHFPAVPYIPPPKNFSPAANRFTPVQAIFRRTRFAAKNKNQAGSFFHLQLARFLLDV